MNNNWLIIRVHAKLEVLLEYIRVHAKLEVLLE